MNWFSFSPGYIKTTCCSKFQIWTYTICQFYIFNPKHLTQIFYKFTDLCRRYPMLIIKNSIWYKRNHRIMYIFIRFILSCFCNIIYFVFGNLINNQIYCTKFAASAISHPNLSGTFQRIQNHFCLMLIRINISWKSLSRPNTAKLIKTGTIILSRCASDRLIFRSLMMIADFRLHIHLSAICTYIINISRRHLNACSCFSAFLIKHIPDIHHSIRHPWLILFLL